VPVGALMCAFCAIAWTRPALEEWDMAYVRSGPPGAPPTSWIAESRGIRPPILKGMLAFEVIFGVMLATLLSVYYYSLAHAPKWPFDGLPARMPWFGLTVALLVLAAAVLLAFARRSVRRGIGARAPWGLAAAVLLTIVALAVLVVDLNRLDYNWATNVTGSVEWALTGYMTILTVALAVATAVAAVYARRGFFNAERYSGLTAVTWFGYFVAAAWLPVFFTVYVVPHL